MDWSKGFSASYYATIVDARTWIDAGRFEITGGSVSRTDEGLRNSADVSCINYDRDEERYIRVYMNTLQEDGAPAHIALFTGLACAPDRDFNGKLVTTNLKCNSVLKPCEDVLLPRGWFAQSGLDAEIIMRELLSVSPAPIDVEGKMPTLRESIVAEENESHLTMIEKILTAIGWRLQLAGDGTILLKPTAKSNSIIFSPTTNDCIETKLSDSYDWYTAPNVIRAVTSERTVVYKDESDSMLSVKNRGREIWIEETDCNLNNGESLERYAERRLTEEQQVNRTVQYTRRFFPDIYPSDHIELRYQTLGIVGSFYIKSQSISIGYGAPVSEEVNGI